MKVLIKQFDVDMEIKNTGIELEVRATPAQGGHQLGDLVVTRTKLIWCPGQTRPENGKAIPWSEFIDYMNSRD